MINVKKYQKKLEDHLLADGFMKLDKTTSAEEVGYGIIILDLDDWDFAVCELSKALVEDGIKMFYRVSVFHFESIVLRVSVPVTQS